MTTTTQKERDQREQEILQTFIFFERLMSGVIIIGALALLAVATSAAKDGYMGAAAFIASAGLVLLATVGWVYWRRWRTQRKSTLKAPSPQDTSSD